MSQPASQSITRKSASNLAFAFVLLPRARRASMAALYAFCREVDDVADDESLPVAERRNRLAAWREDIRAACDNSSPVFPVSIELQPAIRLYGLKFEHFDELIRGVEMDLDTKRYETHETLELYCYRVASVVGLLSIEVFGYSNPRCRDYAISLGKALQYTNILRDVRTDADRGRIYLPMRELERFGVSTDQILSHHYSEQYRAMAASVAERATAFYKQARSSLPPEDRKSMAAAELMGTIYWRLLQRIASRRFDVFATGKVRVSSIEKVFLVIRSWRRLRAAEYSPAYGAEPH